GAMAGAAAGVIDGLWSWPALPQFVPDLGGRLRVLAFLGASYGLAGAALGTAVGLVVGLFWWHTRLGDLLRAAVAMHADTRARDPREALAGLALTLAGIPCVALCLWIGYEQAQAALATRKHMGLVVAVSMAVALGATGAGAL